MSPTRTLDLATGEPGGAKPPAPFAVVFAGPRGETDDPSEVSVVFNRPMRPLDLAGDEAAPPASLVVEGTAQGPRGSWRWMGTSALVFAPETRLPRATSYVVTVPAGTRALDGSTLPAAYSFDFATPPPRLADSTPGDHSDHLKPRSAFELRFTQPVEPSEVQRATKLLVGGAPAAFKVTRPKSDTPTLVKLAPVAPLPLATDVKIEIAPSLRGVEGPRPMGQPETIAMRTYGALDVEKMECSTSTPHRRCAARGYLSLHLTNRVPFASLKEHVRVEGSAVRWSATRADSLDAWAGIDAPLEPGKSYAIVVTKGLKDEYGQTLNRDVRLPFDTDDEWPSLNVGLEGTVFEGDTGANAAAARKKTTPREVPLTAINLPSYELVTGALTEEQVVKLLIAEDGQRSSRFDQAAAVKGVKRETVRPAGGTNQAVVRAVRLDELLASSQGRGAALVGVKYRTGNRGEDDARVVSVTDLAITAKMSHFGSLVWVTRLSDGAPVAGATVSVRAGRGVVTTTTTDANGLAAIGADAFDPIDAEGREVSDALLVARKDGDWTFRPMGERLWTWMYAPWSDTSGRLTPMGMVFSDRGIYKAGETAKVTAMFRVPTAKGSATPKGRTVRITATDAGGEEFHKAQATLDTFGEASIDVKIPDGARLGSFEIRAELEEQGTSPKGVASTMADLAEYRPAEFKVAVAPDKSSYVRGDKIGFVTRGDYLFGAPMGGGDVRYTATRGRTSFAPPGTDGLVVDDDAYAWGLPEDSTRATAIADGNGQLDAKGAFTGALAFSLPHQRGTEVVSIESEVTDVSRQAIAGRASVLVHPAEFYVALKRPGDLFVPKGAKLRPAVLSVDPAGKRRAGVPVKIELIQRTWTFAWEESGDDRHATSSVVDKPVASCAVTTGTDLAACDLAPPGPGYFLIRASAKDRRGNAVAASADVYVLGESDGVGWRFDDTSKLELVTDKKRYEVGDVARVLVKSPFAQADALITVERAGVYRQERKTLTGAMPTLAIPITDDMRPNAFVAVHLVRGRTKDAPEGGKRGADVGGPAFRLGYAELQVNPEARRLKVAIAPSKKDLRPGEEVDADVVVTDRVGHGAKSEVTFYAVDEGVLMLTGYTTPDPIPVFTASRPLAVFSLESRSDLAKVFVRGVGTDKGDEGGGGGAMRADFRTTAYYEPALKTDASGRAHVKFKLPDSLTTYRLMAVAAAEDDRFGVGEEQVIVSRPLMARPNLPRFLRAGDDVVAGVIVSSKGIGAQTVEVTLEAKGIELRGDAKKVIALPPSGNVEVRWSLAATAVGKAQLAFHARAGDLRDDVVVERSVEAPTSLESVALYGETTSAIAEKLGDLRAMRSDVGGLDVRLASSALVGLDDGIEQLIDYPYGCTEQLTSRLVPLVPLRALASDFHVALPVDLGPVIDKTTATIAKNQHADGGFGWWPDDPTSDAWLSAYAVWGLDVAKKGGAFVPEGVIENGTRYLRGRLESLVGEEHVGHATAAFYLDVLAQIGAPDPGYANRLYDARAKMPLFARALLAHAMALSKMDGKQTASLARELERSLRVTATTASVAENAGDRYAVVMDSEARTTAMVVRALLAIDPQHPLAGRLAQGLLGMRRGGTWRTTQETSWALLALDDYRKAQERSAPEFDAHVFLGQALAYQASFRQKSMSGVTTSFPAAKLLGDASGATLALQVEGSGKLFYEARLRYAKKEVPITGLDRGFFVKKIVRSVRPAALKDALATLPSTSAVAADAGDLVLVDLVVVTPDAREQVVIDDPLPAGLEAVQANLATTARGLATTEAGGEGDQADARQSDDDAVASDRAWGSSWYHRGYKDDRVLTFVDHMAAGMYHYRYLARATTRGHFVVPPTRAECMYEPETFGRTGGGTFEVK